MLFLGLILSALVAGVAARYRWLTVDGAAAAILIGTVVLGWGGWGHATLLMLFFISSSLLTRWKRGRKSHPEHRGGRTAGQVLANGAVAAGLAVVWSQAPSPAAGAAFAAAVAASTADTWATEVGMLSPQPPRLITTGKPVPPGVSGGVTWLGTGAAIVGAGLIGAGGRLLEVPCWIPWATGVGAMVLDSVLGAAVEGRARVITNDTVNLLATLSAAGVAALLALT